MSDQLRRDMHDISVRVVDKLSNETLEREIAALAWIGKSEDGTRTCRHTFTLQSIRFRGGRSAAREGT